jgi:hypothetical protein
MDDKEFLKFCYDEHKAELGQCDAIYQRAGFVLTAQTIVGGAVIALGNAGAFGQVFTRIDVFLYYISGGLSLVGVLVSVFFLFRGVCPRRYPNLAPMTQWKKWKEECQGTSNDGSGTTACDGVVKSMTDRICEAQEVNARTNENRRKSYRNAIVAIGVALFLMCAQGLFRFILQVEGFLK